MRPRIDALVAQLLDDLDPTGTVDLLAEYAEPLPVYVIADLLGVPRADHVQLRAWSQAIVHMYEQDVDQPTRDEAVAAAAAFADYVRDAARRAPRVARRRPGQRPARRARRGERG